MRKPRLTVLVLAVVAIPVLFYVLLAAFLFLKPMYDDYSSRVPFEENTWRAADRLDASPSRVQMVDDLLAKNDFYGKTRSDVTALLGEPPDTGYFSNWDMIYWLGPERGLLSIDSEWLVFRLNDDSRVVDYQLVTD